MLARSAALRTFGTFSSFTVPSASLRKSYSVVSDASRRLNFITESYLDVRELDHYKRTLVGGYPILQRMDLHNFFSLAKSLNPYDFNQSLLMVKNISRVLDYKLSSDQKMFQHLLEDSRSEINHPISKSEVIWEYACQDSFLELMNGVINDEPYTVENALEECFYRRHRNSDSLLSLREAKIWNVGVSVLFSPISIAMQFRKTKALEKLLEHSSNMDLVQTRNWALLMEDKELVDQSEILFVKQINDDELCEISSENFSGFGCRSDYWKGLRAYLAGDLNCKSELSKTSRPSMC